MADQTVRVTSLPTNGSAEAIAFELWKYCRNDSEQELKKNLELFARCLNVTKGYAPE